MLNEDLIAYLQSAPNQFNPHEWRDVTGTITDLHVEAHRFAMRVNLPPGLYRCRLETRANAFDMRTAMVEMVRVPDGNRVPVGPWDLDHIHNVMALPMAKTFVNGKLKGGLWFAMPGPEEIAEGRLWADCGFEAEAGGTELVLELIERDRERFSWDRVRFMELRRDDRTLCPLLPMSRCHPRVYLNAAELPGLKKRLLASPQFAEVIEKLRRDLGVSAEEDSETVRRGLGMRVSAPGETGSAIRVDDLDLGALVYRLTCDRGIGARLRHSIVDLCRQPTWSGRPDPLLMGGDNDRGVGFKLYFTGLIWDYAQELFNAAERRVIQRKVGDYLQKMYDFTVLQRAYMGQPTTDPHSLGAWNGVGVACMAFYDDLAIARKALPFFHGLFRDSLQLFPPDGKTIWSTYFPFHLVRYLSAAQTFGGPQPELDASAYLDALGRTLLACFETPNSVELQRGLRTKEHRYLTAYLCRFHRTAGIAAIYQAFVAQEQKSAGNVEWGLFDLLYAPAKPATPAAFPRQSLFAQSIGEIITTVPGKKTIGVSFSAGLKYGRRASTHVMPHNREATPTLGTVEVTIDGTPVLMNIAMGMYGLSSARTNTMSFGEDGGGFTNGQYLNGNVPPEKSPYIRRGLVTDRFIYAHAVVTEGLHPRLQVRRADRIFILDRATGTMVLADSFAGDQPIQFATHLHCSGSVTDLGGDRYRLTGGQANLIAGIKGGDKGLSNEERGEIFATVLRAGAGHRVIVEEPSWMPGYIYGLNATGKEDIRDGKFPHYRRWRLEMPEPVATGAFLLALTGEADAVKLDGDQIVLPDQARAVLAGGTPVRTLGYECEAEAVLTDESAHRLVAIGARKVVAGSRRLEFAVPVDLELREGQGTIYSPAQDPGMQVRGWRLGRFKLQAHDPRSSWDWSAQFKV